MSYITNEGFDIPLLSENTPAYFAQIWEKVSAVTQCVNAIDSFTYNHLRQSLTLAFKARLELSVLYHKKALIFFPRVQTL